jgi:integrase/recombinase XerD
MKNLRKALSDYLSLRRGLGFKLGSDETGLSSFVSFLELQGAEHISTHLAAEWCLRGSAQPISKVRKLCYVRGVAKYLKTIDPCTEIPSQDLIRCRPNRPRPYLYTDEEVQKLMEAALNLDSFNRLRHLTYHYLLGLLSVTGMRISEAINLKVDDVDLDGQLLTVRGTKFGKSRLIPLHATTCNALRKYKSARDKAVKDAPETITLFVSGRYKPLNYRVVLKTFDSLCQQIGIRGQKQERIPRIHDFRHRMAVQTLLRWYRNGDDPERRLPALATYLGHVHVADTYWYLTTCPELMEEAVKLLEQRGG